MMNAVYNTQVANLYYNLHHSILHLYQMTLTNLASDTKKMLAKLVHADTTQMIEHLFIFHWPTWLVIFESNY